MIDPMSIYRIVADDSLPADQRKAQIDALYNPAPEVPAGPDARLAQFVDPSAAAAAGSSMVADSSQAPPAAAPSVADVGPNMSQTPEPNMSPIPPVSVSPETPAATAAQVEAPGGIEGSPDDASFRQIANAVLPPTRGQYVPAHDEPVGTVLEGTPPMSQEIKDKIEKNTLDQQIAGRILADTEAADKAKEAETIDNALFNAQVDETANSHAQAAADKHLAQAQDDYDRIEKETRIAPDAWWSSKNAGQKIVTGLAALLFGIGGQPEQVTKWIDEDMQRRQVQRNERLGAARQRIDVLQSRMSSPEAAQQLHLAMSNRVAAAELDKLAANSQSAEIKDRANVAATELRQKAALYEAEAWQREHGTFKTQVRHVPGGSVGGSSLLGNLKKAKEAGLDPEGLIRAASGGSYGNGKMDRTQLQSKESEMARTVTFPDGTVLYAGQPSQAKDTQEAVTNAGEILNAYNLLEKAIQSPGHTISRTELAKINAIIAQNMVYLKETNRLGQITPADEKIVTPLAGTGAGEIISFDPAVRAQIQQARQLLLHKINAVKKTMFKQPFSNTQRGGTSEADVEGDTE